MGFLEYLTRCKDGAVLLQLFRISFLGQLFGLLI